MSGHGRPAPTAGARRHPATGGQGAPQLGPRPRLLIAKRPKPLLLIRGSLLHPLAKTGPRRVRPATPKGSLLGLELYLSSFGQLCAHMQEELPPPSTVGFHPARKREPDRHRAACPGGDKSGPLDIMAALGHSRVHQGWLLTLYSHTRFLHAQQAPSNLDQMRPHGGRAATAAVALPGGPPWITQALMP